jgi:copper transport protein
MRTTVAAVLVAVCTMLAVPAPAWAHALLVSTTPGNWQLIDASPGSVSMRFSEPVDLGLAQVRLIGPRGNDIAGAGRPEHPEGRPDSLMITVPETLANGTYTVAWRVVSADTHPVQGAFTFSVREATGPAAVALDDPSAGSATATGLYGLARWLALAGFALLVGTALFVAVCWPGGLARRGTRRLMVAGLVTAFGASVATLLLYGPYVGGGSLAGTLGGRIGPILLVRLGLLAGIGFALIRFPAAGPSTRDRVRPGALVLTGTAALASTWSLVTHSAGSGLEWLSVPADVIHLSAAGVWVGGLPVLLGVLLRSGDVAAMRTAIPRFSTIAGSCVGILVATGIYQSWREVGTFPALFSTTYGVRLMVKLGLVAVLLSIGALARLWVRRQYGAGPATVAAKRRARRGPEHSEIGRFRKLVTTETVLAGLLLGMTTALISTEPARAELDRLRNPPRSAAAEGPLSLAVPFDAGGPTGKGQIALAFAPARTGRNELHLAVLDPAGTPKQVPEVRAELRLPEAGIGPIALPLTTTAPPRYVRSGPTHYSAPDVTVPMPGRWELAVVVRTSEINQTTVRVPVNIS